MPYAVFVTADAARDLEELYDYVALHDRPCHVGWGRWLLLIVIGCHSPQTQAVKHRRCVWRSLQLKS